MSLTAVKFRAPMPPGIRPSALKRKELIGVALLLTMLAPAVKASCRRRIVSVLARLLLASLSTKAIQPALQSLPLQVAVVFSEVLLGHSVMLMPRLMASLREKRRSASKLLTCVDRLLSAISLTNDGAARVARMATIVTVTNNSIRVKPRSCFMSGIILRYSYMQSPFRRLGALRGQAEKLGAFRAWGVESKNRPRGGQFFSRFSGPQPCYETKRRRKMGRCGRFAADDSQVRQAPRPD